MLTESLRIEAVSKNFANFVVYFKVCPQAPCRGPTSINSRRRMDFPQIQSELRTEIDRLNVMIREALKVDMPILQRIVDEYLISKGKQIRPIMVLLSAMLTMEEAGCEPEVSDRVLHAGAALELLHNASLIHDDVVDESKRRRGLPTINAVWDNHIAVLTGDFFVSKALAEAVKTGSMEAISYISELGRELSLGEINQICVARFHELSEEEYFRTIYKKTACLFINCARLGSLTAGASAEEAASLVSYAEAMGICFQIKDDIFDYLEKDVGKPTGNDLREGKVTLPLLHALRTAPQEASRPMYDLLEKDELSADDIARLIAFAKEYDGIAYAYSVMEDMRSKAAPLIMHYPDCRARRALEEIFNYIIARDY